VKSGQAIYRALLVLAPRRLRRAHGADMEALFAERLAAARAIGRTAMATAWIHAAGDLLRARVRGWRAERVPLTVYIDERTTIMIGSDLRYAWRALLRQDRSQYFPVVTGTASATKSAGGTDFRAATGGTFTDYSAWNRMFALLPPR